MRAPCKGNGPAHPMVGPDGTHYTGLTMRDHFAAQAMLLAWAAARARLMKQYDTEAEAEQAIKPAMLAFEAYRIADAMLTERGGA